MTKEQFEKFGWLLFTIMVASALTIVIISFTDIDKPKTKTEDTIPYANRVVNEDDPLWNCMNMGNRQCGPGCYMEQSLTPEGYEIVRYDTTGPHPSLGFRIPCPGGN